MKYTNAVEIQNRRINLIYESIVNEGLKDVVKNTAIGGLAGAAGGAAGAGIAKAVGANGKVGTTIGGAAGGAIAGGGAQAAYDKFVNKKKVNWGSVGQAALGGAVTGGGVGYAMGDSKPDARVEPPENPSGTGEQNDDFAPGVERSGMDYSDPTKTGGKHEGPSTPEHINKSDSSSQDTAAPGIDTFDPKMTGETPKGPSEPKTSPTPKTSSTPKTTPKPEKRNAWGRSADHLRNGDIRKAGDDFVQATSGIAKKTAGKAIDASGEAIKTVGRMATDAGSTAIGGVKKASSTFLNGLQSVSNAIFKPKN